MSSTPAFDKLIELTQKLRSDEGCNWSRKQTTQSLRPYLIEEAFEVVEAINEQDNTHLKEELGDLLYQVIFHSQVAQEKGLFSIEDVITSLNEKLIHRHPHVFTNPKKLTDEEIRAQWLSIKKKQTENTRFIEIAKGLPPLSKSVKLQEEAARTGFDWSDHEQIYDKILEEIEEIKEALKEKEFDDVEDELGDLLFAVTSLSRALKVNPNIALERANRKFASRFEAVLELLQEHPKPKTITEWIQLWKNAKKRVT